MSLVFLLPLSLACAALHPSVSPAAAETTSYPAGEVIIPPISFAPLDERVNSLLADTQDNDRRDRLILARELMNSMRSKDPIAQRKVYDYLDQVLKVEERSRTADIGFEGIRIPIEEEVIAGPVIEAPRAATPEVITGARAALADGRYLDAVTSLDGYQDSAATALRKEAVDGWARTERERAGHLFLEARQLAPGNERIASLRAARSALVAINTRFPDNAYYAQIAENIAKVDADLTAAGARP